MLDREERYGFRAGEKDAGLILPVVIDDGESFPVEIQEIQCERIHEFANPFMRPDSPRQEALADYLRQRFCQAIEQALTAVPQFDPKWATLAGEQFKARFQIHTQHQSTLPRQLL